MTGRIITNMVYREQVTEKKNFIWNMIGSGIYAASSMLLSMFVINTIGAKEGGIFSIALTLSQMLVYIAYYEMRTFQVTDTQDEFTFAEYHATKIIMCFVMIIVSALYVFIKQYSLNKGTVIMLVCFVRFLDGYADVYEAQFQKCGRLDLAGKSLAYRTGMFVITLCVVLIISKNLIISLIIADIVAIVGVFVFDIKVMTILDNVACSFSKEKICAIIKKCFPLFVGVFCWTYILSASRIAIDGNMSSEYQAYYQVIFMPVSVINLFSGFVLRPMLPRLSEDYSAGAYKEFKWFLYKGICGIFVITGVCMLGAFVVGIPVLSLLSGCDLDEYKGILVFLLFAGGINAIAYTMYYVLTIMRCPKGILFGYILSALLAFLISAPCVRYGGIKGAAGSYFIVVLVLCMLFGIAIIGQVINLKRNKDK